jgi:hypothetical protein
MRQALRTTIGFLFAAGITVLAPRAQAQEDIPLLPGFGASCRLTNSSTQASLIVRACNFSGGTLLGVTSHLPTVDATGTADVSFLTVPGFRGILVNHNCVSFKWQLGLSGCGDIHLSTEVTAETTDGVTVTTGPLDCGDITLTCVDRSPTPTRTPIRVPTFIRPPTATPRATRTEVPTLTPRPRLPTPTPRPPKELATPRPTRTPLPTATPRPRLASPTPRPKIPTPTLRPSRTPLPTNTPVRRIPTPTQAVPFCPTCLRATCQAIPGVGGSIVSAFLSLYNATGHPITDIVPNPIELDPIGNVTINRVIGPEPSRIALLLPDHGNRFRWDIDVEGLGLLFIHVSATGVGPNGQLVFTARCETNTVNVVSDIVHNR